MTWAVVRRLSTTWSRAWRWHTSAGTRLAPVLVVLAGLVGGSVLLAPLALGPAAGVADRLHPPVLAAITVLFAAAELCVRHLQVRRQATTLSLSELPLAIGLAFLAPHELLLARVVGSGAGFVARGQSPVKVVFNTALAATETLAVLALVRWLAPGAAVLEPRGWVVVPAAVVVGALLSRWVVNLVVRLHDGASRGCARLGELRSIAGRAATCGVLGLTAALALSADARAWALLVVAAALALVAHRHYAVLAESYERTRQLYRFTELTSTAGTVDAVIDLALREGLALLRSEHAEVLLLPRSAATDAAGPAVRRALVEGAYQPGPGGLRESDPVVAHVLGSRTGTVLLRDTRDARSRAFLDSHGLRDAVLVPLWTDGGVAGLLLVGNRAGAVRPYSQDDVRLVESIATQTGMALAAARVIDRLHHDSRHDGLTGLANRAQLNDWLREATTAVQTQGRPAAVLLVDLDGFKAVNDNLGHAQGDELLVWAGRQLQQGAGPSGRVARLGGDEFAVLLLDEAAGAVMARAEALSRRLRRTLAVRGHEVRVGGSIGVALAPVHGSEASALLARADAAMYRAKREGGGVCVWDAGLADGGTVDVSGSPAYDEESGRARGTGPVLAWMPPTPRGSVLGRRRQ